MPERFFFDFVDSFRFLVWMFSFFKAVGLDTCESLFERNVLTKTEQKSFSYIVEFVVEPACIADRFPVCVSSPKSRCCCRTIRARCALSLGWRLKKILLTMFSLASSDDCFIFVNVIFLHIMVASRSPRLKSARSGFDAMRIRLGLDEMEIERERIKRGRHLDQIRFGKIGRSQHQAPLPHQMPVCPPTPRPTIKMTPHTIFPTSSWSWDLKPTHPAHYGFDERLIGAIYLAQGHLYLSFTGDRVIYIYLAQKHCTRCANHLHHDHSKRCNSPDASWASPAAGWSRSSCSRGRRRCRGSARYRHAATTGLMSLRSWHTRDPLDKREF